MGNCSSSSTLSIPPKKEPANESQIQNVTPINDQLETFKQEFDAKYRQPTKQTARLEDFQLQRTIGMGAFSRALSVKHGDRRLALKIRSKQTVIELKQVEHVLAEKRILQAINFPFIVNFAHTFKDNAYLYLALDIAAGGEMFTHLSRVRKYPEEQVCFYAAQILLAFEYLHFLNIIYRNLKVEELLFGSDGYLLIAGFGLAKVVDDRTHTLCGTPQYMAPEVIMGREYTKSVDYWTLGILIVELTAGSSPYDDDDPMQIYKKILRGTYETPAYFSADLSDLVSKILQPRAPDRYGTLKNGIKDIKNHSWFSAIDWTAILKKGVKAPYIPEADKDHFETYDEQPLVPAETVLYQTEFEDF